MDSLMRFLQMYRNQSNMPLRMIVGGHFNIDMKMLQFKKYKSFCPVSRKGRWMNTFIYTRDNLMVVDHTKTLSTEASGKQFLRNSMEITATETPSVGAIERPEKSIYHKRQVRKTEYFIASSEGEQVRLGRKMMLRSASAKTTGRKVN